MNTKNIATVCKERANPDVREAAIMSRAPRLLRVSRCVMHNYLWSFLLVSGFTTLLYFYLSRNAANTPKRMLSQAMPWPRKSVVISDWKGNPARLLTYKKYCVIANFLESTMSKSLENYERITLILHMTYDYFDQQIIDQVSGWDGPISMTIFVSSNALQNQTDNLREKIEQYESQIGSQLSIHLFYLADQGGQCMQTYRLSQSPSDSPENMLNETNGTDFIYPINVARNIARLLSQSKYILISDFEFISSYGFEAAMLTLAQKYLTENPKTALVCRIFEALGNMSTVPRDKDTLYEYYKNGSAVEFHARYAGKAHRIDGLNDWFAHATDEPSIDRNIPYDRADWEPAFVSLATIPFHDENFKYPLRDNTVLRWEMCRMNYTFLVVHDHFLVHPGIKIWTPNVRRQQLIKSFATVARQFLERMEDLYPETNGTCPDLVN